ncbi:MAG TPA: molybdenum cofactor biosynthesis protein MoaE [Acidothermaceae bacterium]|nr:molybdenum cofactor biosynthesis protein MoaE [Acidothermaceae bacterium]
MHVVYAEVIDVDIDLADVVSRVSGPGCGAVATFTGLVREIDQGRRVVELEYVAHDSANRVITEVANDIAAKYDDLIGLAVVHRVGILRVGEVAVVVAASAAHRAAALAACAAAVEEVKTLLPVWKRQLFDDGTDEWVNSP